MKLSEDNLNEILKLNRKHPAFGYEIVETLSDDLLRLTRLCKDIVRVRDESDGDLKALDVCISRIRHAVRDKDNADV